METARLILRLQTKELLIKILGDSIQAQLDFFGYSSKEELSLKIAKINTKLALGINDFQWDLIEKKTKKVIGSAGYHNIVKQHKRGELGYYLKEDFRRKGYMSESLTVILNYGFEVMDFIRIEAFIGPDNLASKALVKKFGFEQEGTLRNHYIANNQIYNSEVYSLLKPVS